MQPCLSSVSSTTPWARSGCRPTPGGRRRPSGRSRTSRSPALPIERGLIAALAMIKGAAALVNARLKVIDREMAQAIADAAAEVARGHVGRPLPDRRVPDGLGHVVEHERQRGDRDAGVGARSARRSTPTTTSTRRSPPTTCSRRPSTSPRPVGIVEDLIPALEHLAARAAQEAAQFAKVVKSGRTHLMDATPVTLGQEFGGYAAAIEHGIERLQAVLPRVGELPLGGTAVGTGINAPKAFAKRRHHAARRRHGPAAHRGPRPLRGPGGARRAWSRRRGRCASSRCRSSRSPTTSAGWAAAPHRARRDPHPRPAARSARSCRAR